MKDISDGDLLAFARGGLSDEERRRVERRLDASPEEGEVVAKLVQLFGDLDETVVGDEGLETTPRDAPPNDVLTDPSIRRPGTELGRYLVIGELGHGGMGVVHRAYDPKLQREVALKCLRPGRLSSELQSRLVREAQAMAKLNHPNVVSVYDVELLGQQFVLVMEYVEGAHLGAWLQQRPRPWREVIDVFIAAGRGLVAAHAAGLLHRDFKPANVLISAATGEVKVTDFGVAWMDESVASVPPAGVPLWVEPSEELDPFLDGGRLTEMGQVMGTPLYMPPEQLAGHALTPAADQYAFCVSLWQGLAGALPFTADAAQGSLTELIHLKAEGPPRWPSTAAPVPRRFVDAIIRGMAPDPEARWPSMAALLAELGSDPTRRVRRLSAAGALVVVGAGALVGYGYVQARAEAACEAEGRAIDEVWNAERDDAIAQAFRDTGISYAADTWSRASPRLDAFAASWAEARTQVCREGELHGTRRPQMLALARACLDQRRALLRGLAEQLAEPDDIVVSRTAAAAWGLPSMQACLDEAELSRVSTAFDAPELQLAAQALDERLADVSAMHRTGQYDEAVAGSEAALHDAVGLGQPRLVAAARMALGDGLYALGRYEEAEDAFEAAFYEASVAGDDMRALQAASQLMFTVGDRLARYDEGKRWAWLARMLQERLKLGDDHYDVAVLLNNLAALHAAAGDSELALKEYQQALVIREATQGADHPDVATIVSNVGNTYLELGRYDEALPLLERTLAICEAAYGPGHPELAMALNNLGNAHMMRGAPDQALVAHQRALMIREAALGPDHPDMAITLNNIGSVYNELHQYDEALEAHRRAQVLLERALGPNHPDVASSLNNLANAHMAKGEYDEALAANERGLAISEQLHGPDHVDVAMALNSLGSVHIERRAPDQALPLLQRALSIWEAGLGPEHPYVAAALLNLGTVRRMQGEHDQALAALKRALTIWERTIGAHHVYVGSALLEVGLVLVAQERHADALGPLQRAQGIFEQPPGSTRDLAETRFGLARALWGSGGDQARAAELARQALVDFRGLSPRPSASVAEVRAWLDGHGLAVSTPRSVKTRP